MSAEPVLQGYELVTHVFVAANRDRGDDDIGLIEFWGRCRTAIGLSDGVPGYPAEPDGSLEAVAGAGGVLAVARAPGPDLHQAVLRREHDVACLSVIRCPGRGDARRWPELEAEWHTLSASAIPGVIGSAHVLQARVCDGDDPDPVALGPVVRAVSDLDGPWADGGTQRVDARLGPFVVWEAPPTDDPPVAWQNRAHRRIVVVAPADHDAELSAWTWSRGDADPTPLTRYLTNAAVLHHQLGQRPVEAGRELRRMTDRQTTPLLRLIGNATGDERAPDGPDLDPMNGPLVRLKSAELALVDRIARLREIRRTAEIAARNMALDAGPSAAGPFAEDRVLAEWLNRQLDDDTGYLEATLDRARIVIALADQIVQRGLQSRQERLQHRKERFDLGLTGLVGAILMALAAIQALQYRPPLPPPAVPATITALALFALVMSLIVVRVAATGRRGIDVALRAAIALLGAAVAWALQASVVPAAPSSTSWACAGIGAVVVGLAAIAWRRRPGRPSSEPYGFHRRPTRQALSDPRQ